MVLRLSPDHVQTMATHAAQAYPKEGCGLLLGKAHQGSAAATLLAAPDISVVTIVPLDNAWNPEAAAAMAAAWPDNDQAQDPDQPHSTADRYWINPQDLMVWQRTARDRGLDIVGVYHSHPDHPAVPSECDRRLAWPGYAYLIMAVYAGESTDWRCWMLDENHQFQAEAMELIFPPDPVLAAQNPPQMSQSR